MCKVSVFGDVKITNGDFKYSSRNHLLNNCFRGIFDCLLLSRVYSNSSFVYLPANSWYIKLGTDTTTITTPTMNELTSLIDILPSSKQILVTDDINNNNYITTYRCIWNIGTISGTIGEAGLYMRTGNCTDVYSNGYNITYAPPVKMISRLACADSDFSPIVINPEYPFIIDWSMNFQL